MISESISPADSALPRLMAVLASLALVCSFPAQAQQGNKRTTLHFYNHTDATVRVEAVDLTEPQASLPMVVAPDDTKSIPMRPGRTLLDVVAIRAEPLHIHRIELEFEAGRSKHYRFSASVTGRYLMIDADLISSMPVLPTEPADANNVVGHQMDPLELTGEECKPPLGDRFGVVIWDPSGEEPPTYYRDRIGHLCAVDGSSFYHKGAIYERYNCVAVWRNCTRDPEGDATVSPPVRTSEVDDTARRLASRDNPLSDFVETWEFNGRSSGGMQRRFSKYTVTTGFFYEDSCSDGYILSDQGRCMLEADMRAQELEESIRVFERRTDK